MNRQDQCRLIILEFAEKINEDNKIGLTSKMMKVLSSHKFSDSYIAKQVNYLHDVGAINKTLTKNKDGRYEFSPGSWILLNEAGLVSQMLHNLRSNMP